MTRCALLRLEADLDVLNATQRHEQSRPGYGAHFLDEVEACIERIQSEPLSFPEVDGSVRRALLKRFRYAIYFRIIDDDEIDVLAVLHQHEELGKWRTR